MFERSLTHDFFKFSVVSLIVALFSKLSLSGWVDFSLRLKVIFGWLRTEFWSFLNFLKILVVDRNKIQNLCLGWVLFKSIPDDINLWQDSSRCRRRHQQLNWCSLPTAALKELSYLRVAYTALRIRLIFTSRALSRCPLILLITIYLIIFDHHILRLDLFRTRGQTGTGLRC